MSLIDLLGEKFFPINPMTYPGTPKRAIQYYALGNSKLVVKTPLLSQGLHTGRQTKVSYNNAGV
jgi:hypothetical protein